VNIVDIISAIAANSEGLISAEEIRWEIDETISDISVYLSKEKIILIKWSIFEQKKEWERRVILAHEIAHHKHNEIRKKYWSSLMIAEEILCDWFICKLGFKDDLQKFRLQYPAYGKAYADLFEDYLDLPKLSETSHKWLFYKRAGLV
jgi:hypothetical protein